MTTQFQHLLACLIIVCGIVGCGAPSRAAAPGAGDHGNAADGDLAVAVDVPDRFAADDGGTTAAETGIDTGIGLGDVAAVDSAATDGIGGDVLDVSDATTFADGDMTSGPDGTTDAVDDQGLIVPPDGLADTLADVADVLVDATDVADVVDVPEVMSIPDVVDVVSDLYLPDLMVDVADAPTTDTGPGAGQDGALTVDGSADAKPWPTAEPAGPTCKDKRQRGDMKAKSDACWAPPAHYCSGSEGAMLWFGCSPDQSACCLYDIFCRPCGWKACPMIYKTDPPPTSLPPGCPKYYVLGLPPPATVPLECQPYEPNDTEFCWDDAPPEWSTKEFHEPDHFLW